MTQYLVLLAAGVSIAAKAKMRRMTLPEWMLAGFVVLNIFLVQLQMFVGENGKLEWILRYHQASLTLLYGWAAWGAIELIRFLDGRKRILAVVATALWLVSTGGTSLWRIVKHDFVQSRRAARAQAEEWALDAIRRDWKGPARDEKRFFTVQEYHPSSRPIICSEGARLPYLAKGRWYSKAKDVRRHEKPDYALLPKGVRPPGRMRLMSERSFGRKQYRFCLYRAAQ